jgi:hypothetical protein
MLPCSVFDFHHEPIGFRHPLNPRGSAILSGPHANSAFVLALFNLAENLCGIQLQQIAKEIRLVRFLESLRFQDLARTRIDEQGISAAICHD